VFALYGQELLRTWNIPPYKVQLLRHEHVEHNWEMRPGSKPKSYMKTYLITKDGEDFLQLSYHKISKDSCIIDFLEATPNRPKNGHVANMIQLNLCQQTMHQTKVEKPAWDPAIVQGITIQPLAEVFLNQYNPHSPIEVQNFNQGHAIPLHTKNVTGFYLLFESSYILAPYYEEEFTGPNKPHFRLFLEGEFPQPKEVLLYWDRFIVDGYVYGMGEKGIEPFSNRFWSANLKLLELE
jgi:hypothetical protein